MLSLHFCLKRSLLPFGHGGQKKRRTPEFFRCSSPIYLYIMCPRAANIRVFTASESLYSLCDYSSYRRHTIFIYRVMPAKGLMENGCKNTQILAHSKIFPHFSCISQPLFVDLRINWGIRRSCLQPSSQNKTATIRQRL